MNKNRAEELLVPLKKGTANGISSQWKERLIEALEYVIENESTPEDKCLFGEHLPATMKSSDGQFWKTICTKCGKTLDSGTISP